MTIYASPRQRFGSPRRTSASGQAMFFFLPSSLLVLLSISTRSKQMGD